MHFFICNMCGHVAFNRSPDQCPVCGSKLFTQNDGLFKESAEKSKEGAVKHIPQVEIKRECKFIPETGCLDVMVRIGKTLHPMEEKHFITFIDCYGDEKYLGRVLLTPGINPAACFHIKNTVKSITVVERCNLHGHWMSAVQI
jgi:superoxide reductase